MTPRSPPADTRRRRELLLAGGYLLALALLVVSLPTIAAAIGADDAMVINDTTTEPSFADRTALIGGGPGGAAAESQIGVERGSDATTPFRNTSAEREFTVRTAAPAYWRTDAYDRYDGRWIRTGSHDEYTGTIPASGPVTVPVAQNVTVDRGAAALPAAYQPAQVVGTETEGVTVSPETGLHPSAPVEANTTYTVNSYRYQPNIDLLRSAGANYPVSIEQRYTQLPEDVPDRVEALGTEVTADADTPFEAANTIDNSLAADKAYDLTATHEPGADPVDQFLFEMEGGDAQYFASSMVVLLRTQGIPARYVTGYSVGEPVPDEEDTYAVRSVNAHAWVEVYFSGHGWIAFDPTPVADRIAVEDAAVDRPGAMAHVPLPNENVSALEVDIDQILDDPLPTDDDDLVDVDFDEDEDLTDDLDDETDEDAADGEGDGDGDAEDGEGDGDDVTVIDETSPDGAPPLSVTLSPETPQPGASLTVTVTRDGEPVRGLAVLFNGESIGETDAQGSVSGTVPYVRTLEITVTSDSSSSSVSSPVTVHAPATLAAGVSIEPHAPRVGGVRGSFGGDTAGVRASQRGVSPGVLESTATTARAPTETAPADTSLDVADMTTDEMDTTNALAAATAADPHSDPRAGSVRPQTTDESNTTVVSVDIDAVTSLEVTPDPLVDGGEATVRMLANGQPVPSAEVQIDDTVVGETDSAGRASVTVPPTGSDGEVTVSAQRGEISATQTVVAGALQVDATHAGDHALPGRAATVDARVGSVPVEGATVQQDGETIGETDAAGTATATLPAAQTTAFTVTYAGTSASSSVDGMAHNAGLLGIALLAVTASLGLVVRRYRRGNGISPGLGSRLSGGAWLRSVSRIGVAAGSWLTTRLLGLQTMTAGLSVRLLAALRAPHTAVLGLWRRRPTPIWAPLVAVIALLAAVVRQALGSAAADSASGSAVSEAPGDADGSAADSVRSVRQAWGVFIRLLGDRIDTTRTPAELARAATERGFPREPVERLTESFRAVEYGRDAADEHAETAATALTDLELTATADDPDHQQATAEEQP